ncbi:MAG TPA: C4-dicarboxylate TRAP transporter substrate-binding protein [Chthoniobacteraceae bacterium]|nr:C4-dicarboxylate TRAP transporter substrate-binding protein [Chthoniobacteraceae bacterium]
MGGFPARPTISPENVGVISMDAFARLASVAACTVGISFPAFAEKITLKIASGHNASWTFIQQTQDFFIPEVKKRVKERTQHEVEFIEGFAGAMVKPTEVLESLQSGVIDIGVFCACHESQKLALHNFPMYLPFGPDDANISIKATRAVYDSVPELNATLEKTYSQKLLALFPFESYNLVSRFPINGPADLKGRKVGAAGPNLFWVEPTGALPLTVVGPEVYTSFQSGLMDVNIVFASVVDMLKLYDVAPYLVNVRFGSMSITPLNINLRRFNRLPREVQDILVEVGRDAEARSGKYIEEFSQRMLELVKKNGAKVVDISESERLAWARSIASQPGEITKKLEAETKQPIRRAMQVYMDATRAAGHKWPVEYKID